MKFANQHGWWLAAVIGGIALLAIGLPIAARILRGGSK
jgi:hypothetical protein